MDSQREKELILKAKKDPHAFGEIFDYYYPQIYGFIIKRTGNIEIAKDLTSEVFFQALKSLWRFKFMNRPFRAWLYKIATVQIAQCYRKNQKTFEITLDQAPELMSSTFSDHELKEEQASDELQELNKFLQKQMVNLSNIQQTVLTLRFFEDKKIKDIAEILDLKENTIKSHLRRGLKKLEKDLLKIKNDKGIEIFKEYAYANFSQKTKEKFTHAT